MDHPVLKMKFLILCISAGICGVCPLACTALLVVYDPRPVPELHQITNHVSSTSNRKPLHLTSPPYLRALWTRALQPPRR